MALAPRPGARLSFSWLNSDNSDTSNSLAMGFAPYLFAKADNGLNWFAMLYHNMGRMAAKAKAV